MFFQLQDIRRRRQPTWGLANQSGWHTAIDSTPTWNYQRGIMIGFVTTYFQKTLTNFLNNSKLLAKYYEPPISLHQAKIWFNAVLNLDSYKKGIKEARQLAIFGSFFDIGLKLAVWRQFNSGWQVNFNAVEHAWYRKIPTTAAAFIVTSPFAVVGEMVLRAFHADKTFPTQLQKGYTSFFNALRRIPFEEGPYYLFKNTFPLFVKHTLGPFTAFLTYDNISDKLSVIWKVSDTPMYSVKIPCALLSSYLGTVFTYPFVHYIKDMVDLMPKVGVDPWRGNYRKAAVTYIHSPNFNNGMAGLFKRYFWHVFPLYFSTLLIGDYFGMFNYWNVSPLLGPGDNTPEDSYY